ncbi:MAG: MarR family winged helix-turn-helix transcriptional regulator [Myxococcota bacterium]
MDSSSNKAERIEKRYRAQMALGWTERSEAARSMTEICLLAFRLNAALLSSGDTLVAPLGLTSARWQVLGAVALSAQPVSVPQIALRMGLTRQAVQRHVHHLRSEGFVSAEENPYHARSPNYLLTESGRDLFARVDEHFARWSEALAEELDDIPLDAVAKHMERMVHAVGRGPNHNNHG